MDAVLDLVPHLEKCKPILPDLWNFLGDVYLYWDKDPDSGKLWNIEARLFLNLRTIPFVREDWLKMIDMPEPTTLKEYEDISKVLDADTVYKVNKLVKAGSTINLILTQEALHEKKIAILADKIASFNPIRWKILRMLPVKSQNDEAKEFFPTDEEYVIFIKNNKELAEKAGIKVVLEDNEDMTGSYLMISPDGKFFNNVEGCLNYSEPILNVGIEEALKQTPLRREVFYKREGDYSSK
jgi:hypothetical protein